MLIDKLWELQQLQLDYRQKEHSLEESDLSSMLTKKIAATEEQLTELRGRLEGFKAEEVRIGEKLDELSVKVHEAGARLGKEEMSEEKVQKLEDKMKKLTLEKEKIEDAQSKNFHERQDVEDQARALELLLERLHKELQNLPASNADSRAAIKKSLPALKQEIALRKSKLPLKSKLIFESLSEKFSEAPVAKVENSTCDYCHVKLSQKTLFNLRHAEESASGDEDLIRCEICGKILYDGTKNRE